MLDLWHRIAGMLVASALAAMLLTACGGGGSDSSADSTTNSPKTKTTASQEATPEGSQGEPSREFVGKGPNGKLATVGKESSPAEREAASRVLEESLKAREEGDWEAQCATLVGPLVQQLEEGSSVLGAGGGCPRALEAQATPVPESARANTMTGPIDAFRVKSNQAFAFYHGTEGKDYVIPMIKEGGEWKLASLKEEEAP